MTEHLFFYLGLSLLTMHEMDAIRCKEWRIFPGLSMLPDKAGHAVFLFAHIPIFYVVFWKLSNGQEVETFMEGFNFFMIVHLGLHLLFLLHRKNQFRDGISWSIIAGAGFCGFLDLVIT